MINITLVVSYIMAIVAANFTIMHFGAKALPITAFFLIPFDLVARDLLHERWEKGLKLKMTGLILSGSLLSFALNYEVKNIAMASFVAFASAGAINSLFFELFKKKDRQLRMNISNFFAAIADSVLFQIVAFGVLDNFVTFSQTGLKFLGGIFWIKITMRFLK